MSGRVDFEERKQRKKEIYEERITKAEQQSKEHYKNYQIMANAIPLGQPILVDHYSATATRNGYKKMNTQFDKSVRADEKADYYRDKLDSLDNNNAISSDDPHAIEKLESKLQSLEEQRKKIKAREHQTYELTNIGAEIRRIKERIENIKELDQLNFEDITFNGGKIVHNKEQNRIQIIFDSIPDEDTRNFLKHNGFKWSRFQKAWQRLFNKNGIYAANKFLKYCVKETSNNEI